MQLLDILPHLNAVLNALSGVLLTFGFYFIKRKEIKKHRACMVAAFVTSVLFLIFYLTHHSIRTYYFGLGPTKFAGEGISRPIYFTILLTHTILATANVPFILYTLYNAVRGKFEIHKKFARYVFPSWLYVSITGVVVYLMLYQIYAVR
jgi:putative membrane protein